MAIRPTFLSAREAVAQVASGSTIAITGSGGGVLEPGALLAALERRFLDTGAPRDLTFVHALGIGDRDHRGMNAYAHAGMTRRVIAGHWTWSPRMVRLAQENRIEGYAWPSGVISQLLREIGARRPGLLTRTGLQTFVDPRRGGGRVNDVTEEELVELVRMEGREYLRYKPLQIDVAFIRGSAADPHGNITCAGEAAQLDVLAVAQAARACGGKVVAQVKQRVPTPLDPRLVHVPRVLVDEIVEEPCQWQTYVSEHDPSFCGDAPGGDFTPDLSDPLRTLIARRAAMEITPGSTVNVGFGISSQVVDVLAADGRLNALTLAIEQGLMDGIPLSGDFFGIARGPSAVLPSTTQFDLFNGGILDVCCLGLAELDGSGAVNVSRIHGRVVGPGGFIDISQHARKAVFCGTFTAKGLDVEVESAGTLRIRCEGRIPKLVERVSQVTYSGELACAEGREAVYITERAVFRLTPEGVELIEVAPGIDIATEILPRMGFTPIIRDVQTMPPEMFHVTPSSATAMRPGGASQSACQPARAGRR